MAEKTPVSVLQELCIQENESVPIYDVVSDPADSKTFTYVVSAFDLIAKGSGRSKREAKHEASAKLINYLKNMDRFKDKLKEVPPTPRPTSETDAVGTLLDICVQRNWPIASFEVQQACGQPHAPEFTVECRLASIKRTGTFSTKKGAKQIAAKAMLQIIQNLPSQSEGHQQVATLEADPAEKTLRTYREMKKSDIKPVAIRLSQRHNYFLRLPEEDKRAAYEILMGNSGQCGDSPKNKVDLVCKALKIEYEVSPVCGHPLQYKTFILKGDYDCVLVGREPELYEHIEDYFKTMLNFQMVLF